MAEYFQMCQEIDGLSLDSIVPPLIKCLKMDEYFNLFSFPEILI